MNGQQSNLEIDFKFPPIFAINERLRGNSIQQVILPQSIYTVSVTEYKKGRKQGYMLTPINGKFEPILTIKHSAIAPDEVEKSVRIKNIDFSGDDLIV